MYYQKVEIVENTERDRCNHPRLIGVNGASCDFNIFVNTALLEPEPGTCNESR